MLKILAPLYTLKIVGDATLRPVLDIAAARVGRDREVRIKYFFANGAKRAYDATIICEEVSPPQSPKPWRRVRLSHVASTTVIAMLTAAMKECINDSE